MQVFSSSDARNHLSELLALAQREPICIQKQGRDAAVLLSHEEYARLTHAPTSDFQQLCDQIGLKAHRRGLTEKKLKDILGHAAD